jgi:putative metalloprotease
MRMWLAILGLGLLVGCSGRATSSADRWLDRNGGCCEAGTARLARVAARFDRVLSSPIKTVVLDRSELRAYSFPSGEVIVSRGLLSACSDDELTAVIGHELGHLLHDGHATAALVGQVPAGGDVESAADAASVRLLTAIHVPTGSMRSALQKVHDSLPADSDLRVAIAARMRRLP